ncbi:type II CAAX endopeptidase family protein [Paludicola sp. MB14-C6]|uniref:CPBP family intramembrane glutamic endopeptidase n=1 Tax=Paludihabitans sp. MB14-C6 TaxID=3070656 RepID=UPI0027DB2BF2|nr:type II CAAX endopeptidase family protein [Paludicola sp. MB14-C6]WMJ23394.1 type II CAAX endopeptidase family protein [Paludicola sp. MB14-C6]
MKTFFKQFGKGLLYFLLFLGVQLMVIFIMQFFAAFQLGREMGKAGIQLSSSELITKITEKVMSLATLITLIAGVLTIIVLVIEFLIRKKNFFTEVGIHRMKGATIIPIMLFGIGFNVFVSIIMQLIPFPQDLMNSYIEQSSNLTKGNMVVNILATACMAPIVEEIIFRGLMLTRFQKGMPTMVAVLLSSSLFALSHGQIIWMIYSFVLGVILCLVFIRTKSLLGNILLHFSFNSVSAVMMLMKVEDVNDEILPILLVASIVVCIATIITVLFLTKEKKESVVNEQQVVGV